MDPQNISVALPSVAHVDFLHDDDDDGDADGDDDDDDVDDDGGDDGGNEGVIKCSP